MASSAEAVGRCLAADRVGHFEMRADDTLRVPCRNGTERDVESWANFMMERHRRRTLISSIRDDTDRCAAWATRLPRGVQTFRCGDFAPYGASRRVSRFPCDWTRRRTIDDQLLQSSWPTTPYGGSADHAAQRFQATRECRSSPQMPRAITRTQPAPCRRPHPRRRNPKAPPFPRWCWWRSGCRER